MLPLSSLSETNRLENDNTLMSLPKSLSSNPRCICCYCCWMTGCAADADAIPGSSFGQRSTKQKQH
jgi:hypothetical protein